MNKIRLLFLTVVSLGLASTAFAGTGNNGSYGILFWLFISFGVLVIMAQLIPAVLVIIGFSKGITNKHKLPEPINQEKVGY